jgi:hypothetical protein
VKFGMTEFVGSNLSWRRDGVAWILVHGRRRMGRVVPDSKYPSMYRIALPSGRLSDMANLSWTKSLALEAAERELAFEGRRRPAIDPAKCPIKCGVLEGKSSRIDLNTGFDPGVGRGGQ